MHLAIRHLSAGFGSRVLFADLSLEISSGEIKAVMGPSGSGKSTLIGIIAGAVQPTSGEVVFRPEDDESKPQIEWVVQSSPLLNRRSVIDNVELGYRIRFGESDDLRPSAIEMLSLLGLGHLENSAVHALSGGERQRTSIARAALARPNVVLADEPTASLDPDARQAVVDVLRSLASSGAIVLVATHDPFVSEQCDGTLVLADLNA